MKNSAPGGTYPSYATEKVKALFTKEIVGPVRTEPYHSDPFIGLWRPPPLHCFPFP